MRRTYLMPPAAVVAAALAFGLAGAASLAQAQQAGPTTARTAQDALGAEGAERGDVRRGGLNQQLPPAPNRSTGGLRAGAEIGASDAYGFNDSELNERVRRAYSE